ncbi:hypothetical protein EAF04_005850 [Stromatinia cepivora]|nr:hypothetical protein EAF04_005850 [Stromatinia cepivora]
MSSRSSTSEPPTPSSSKSTRSCANCRKTETSMGSFPSCERCKTPYCSRDCQKANWPTHEPNCKERYKFSITIHGDTIPDGLDIDALKKRAEQDGKEFQFIQLSSGQKGRRQAAVYDSRAENK